MLSNHWLRFAVVPWSDDLTRPAERQALAQGVLDEIYGDNGAFEICISEAGYASRHWRPRCRELRASNCRWPSRWSTLPLLSLQPLLMQAFAPAAISSRARCRFRLPRTGQTDRVDHYPRPLAKRAGAQPAVSGRTAGGADADATVRATGNLPQRTLLIGCSQSVHLQSVAGVPVECASAELSWPAPSAGAWG